MNMLISIMYLIVVVLVVTLFLLIFQHYMKTKKLSSLLIEDEQDEMEKVNEVEENKKEKYFLEDATFEEVKEHLKLLKSTKEEFFNSNSLNQEIEVDFIIGSSILKNWDVHALLSSDNKIILKKVVDEKTKDNFTININENKEAKPINTKTQEEITCEENEPLIPSQIDINEIKNEVIEDNSIQGYNENTIILNNDLNDIKNIYNKKELFETIYGMNREKIKNAIYFLFNKLQMDNELKFFYDEKERVYNLSLDTFIENIHNSFSEIFDLDIELYFDYTKVEIIDEITIEFICNLNQSLDFDLFKIIDQKNKKHIAKKYLVIFDENDENEISFEDYFLIININENIIDIKDTLKTPTKIIRNYHQIKLYNLNKTSKNEKPF